MSLEISDGSSDSTDPPSLANLAVQPKTLQPLYVHRTPPEPPLIGPSSSYARPKSAPPNSSLETSSAFRSHRSNLYTLATGRSRQVFVDVKTARPEKQQQAQMLSNPMAVHLARRQAQAARIMAGEDSENALLFRPCRIDLKYKSPRRLRQIFRRRSSQSPWTSQYIGDIYYPVEVTQEFGRWVARTPPSNTRQKEQQVPGLLPLIAMDSPQRADDPESCCARYVWPFQHTSADMSQEISNPNSPATQVGMSHRFKNKGFTDSELAWAMNRTCRVRKPWATIIEKERASRGELRYAGIKLLAGLLEARAGWPTMSESTGELSAAIRSLCHEGEDSRLDYIKRRKTNETCVPDWVLQLMMPMIAPLTPRRGCYTLLSETVSKAQAHFNTLSEAALMEIQNNMCHLNLNQLSHMRLALPEKSFDGSLRKVRVRDLISTCEQLIGQRFWSFLSQRVRPSSAIYEALLSRATDALLSHTLLPSPSDLMSIQRKTSKIMSDWSSTVSNTPSSDRLDSLDSVASLVAASLHGRCLNLSARDNGGGGGHTQSHHQADILELAAKSALNFVELPKLRVNVKQNLGLALLEILGVLCLSKDTRTELLEEPITTLSDRQSWWLLFTGDLTKAVIEKPAAARKRASTRIASPDFRESSAIPLDVIDEQFEMCFIRLPALELRFVRPNDEDIFTINEMVKPEGLGGSSVWAIRAIPPEVEDLSTFAPVDPSAYLGGLFMNDAFKKRREAADSHALTNTDMMQLSHKPRQRLRSASRNRITESPIKILSSRQLSTKMIRRAPTVLDWLNQTTPQQKVAEIYGTSAV